MARDGCESVKDKMRESLIETSTEYEGRKTKPHMIDQEDAKEDQRSQEVNQFTRRGVGYGTMMMMMVVVDVSNDVRRKRGCT